MGWECKGGRWQRRQRSPDRGDAREAALLVFKEPNGSLISALNLVGPGDSSGPREDAREASAVDRGGVELEVLQATSEVPGSDLTIDSVEQLGNEADGLAREEEVSSTFTAHAS